MVNNNQPMKKRSANYYPNYFVILILHRAICLSSLSGNQLSEDTALHLHAVGPQYHCGCEASAANIFWVRLI